MGGENKFTDSKRQLFSSKEHREERGRDEERGVRGISARKNNELGVRGKGLGVRGRIRGWVMIRTQG